MNLVIFAIIINVWSFFGAILTAAAMDSKSDDALPNWKQVLVGGPFIWLIGVILYFFLNLELGWKWLVNWFKKL